MEQAATNKSTRLNTTVLWTILAAAVIVPILCIIGIHAYIRYAEYRNLGPQDYKRIETLLATEFVIPPDWQRADPFPPQMLAAVRDAFADWKVNWAAFPILASKAYYRSIEPSLPGANLSDAPQILEKLTPFLSKVSTLSALPDFETEVYFPPPIASPDEPLEALHGAIYLLQLKSAVMLQDSRSSDSLAAALEILRIGVHHPASEAFSIIMAARCIQKASNSLAVFAVDCEDTITLRLALSEMQSLEPRATPACTMPCSVRTMIGGLRSWKRYGYPVDLSSGQFGCQLFDQYSDGIREFMYWMIAHKPPNDPGWTMAQKTIDSFHHGPINEISFYRKIVRTTRFGIVRDLPGALDIISGYDSHEEFFKDTSARYDLAQITLACRIRQLEYQVDTTSTAHITPDLLPREPTDPFSQKPYKWSSNARKFYSVGPDRVDDHLTTTCDYSKSPPYFGDIALPMLGPL